MKILALKIKLKHLGEESRIIKHQEQKMRGKNWGAKAAYFREHRIHTVRFECRATHIAYGFLRGREYRQIENCPRYMGEYLENKLWKRVEIMVSKYGGKEAAMCLKDWKMSLKMAA